MLNAWSGCLLQQCGVTKETCVSWSVEFSEMFGAQMKGWILWCWSPTLPYMLKVSIFLNGWFNFLFLKVEDSKKIANIPWI